MKTIWEVFNRIWIIYPKILLKYGGKRFSNYILNDVEIFFKKPKLKSYPRFIDLALTDNCNLKCIMCLRTTDPTIELNELNFKQVRNIIDKVSEYATTIQLAGGLGEPLLYKHIFDAIKYSKEKGLEVLLTSNGTLFNNKNVNELINSGLDYLSLSIDAATKETYEGIRVGANFEKTIKGIKNLCKKRKEERVNLKIEFVPVIMVGKNLHEVLALVSLAKEVGVDGIAFSDVSYWVGKESAENYAIRKTKDKKEIKDIFREAKELGKELNIDVRLPPLELPSNKIVCYQPWYLLPITTKGDVRPCCGVHNIFMGNIFEQSLEGIWNSKEFVEWRRRMNTKNPPEACIKCPMRF